MDDPRVADGRLAPLSGQDWAYRRPPVLMPVPAGEVSPLSGQRLVLHEPSRGLWRYDLRAASEPHRYDGTWCVGVLAEADYYRRQHQPEMAAALVPRPWPLEQLWYEQPVDLADEPTEPDYSDSDVTLDMGHAAHLVDDTSRPPVRHLLPALNAPSVQPGMRVCLMGHEGPVFGLRVVGAPRIAEFPETLDLSGGDDLSSLDNVPTAPAVPLCWEHQWYWWLLDGVPPAATDGWLVPIWVE